MPLPTIICFGLQTFPIFILWHKLHYSVVEKKNTDQNAKVMETITINDGSKKYNATLMFIAKLILA